MLKTFRIVGELCLAVFGAFFFSVMYKCLSSLPESAYSSIRVHWHSVYSARLGSTCQSFYRSPSDPILPEVFMTKRFCEFVRRDTRPFQLSLVELIATLWIVVLEERSLWTYGNTKTGTSSKSSNSAHLKTFPDKCLECMRSLVALRPVVFEQFRNIHT